MQRNLASHGCGRSSIVDEYNFVQPGTLSVMFCLSHRIITRSANYFPSITWIGERLDHPGYRCLAFLDDFDEIRGQQQDFCLLTAGSEQQARIPVMVRAWHCLKCIHPRPIRDQPLQSLDETRRTDGSGCRKFVSPAGSVCLDHRGNVSVNRRPPCLALKAAGDLHRAKPGRPDSPEFRERGRPDLGRELDGESHQSSRRSL
jgi:hypothetical protein